MYNRFSRAGKYRPIIRECMVLKCEYHIKLHPGDEFLFMKNGKRLIVPYRLQIKTRI